MPFEKGKSGNPNTQFTSDNQPDNRGRKGKSITQYLKDLGDDKSVKFSITITDKDGNKTTKKGAVRSRSTLNELLANLLWVDALKGNPRARSEVLDRLEGRPQQSVDVTVSAPVIKVVDVAKKQE